ncbi:hypothetical protein SLS62_000069 [Diatrype stigma]|uniref:Uncharacterized protein n=1 Tax=Diatrype stigma TaxID=117547 RepID=A0AAN9V264_9PEZI
MAAQADVPAPEPPPPEGHSIANLWKKLIKKSHFPSTSPRSQRSQNSPHSQRSQRSQGSKESRPPSPTQALIRKVSRKVVPGLPRVKTFKRQQSELREKLEPILPSPAERRAVSVDRRLQSQRNLSLHREPLPRGSAPDFLDDARSVGAQDTTSHTLSQPQTPADDKPMMNMGHMGHVSSVSVESSPAILPVLPQGPRISTLAASSTADIQSITTTQYDTMIHDELESKWILNLSMHFRDKSQREKFFVTYRERDSLWRRVTISLDYRKAPEDSLENDLHHTKYQREKSAKIYEAIRESLQDIQFYDTVTNLKLQTTDGRLHVHVVEDVNVRDPRATEGIELT